MLRHLSNLDGILFRDFNHEDCLVLLGDKPVDVDSPLGEVGLDVCGGSFVGDSQ